ncbi:ATP-binding cassette domain-containing protein [Streptococcus suis]|nr:ATP-binding cassette domain-containing protein [Streptococcus suis]
MSDFIVEHLTKSVGDKTVFADLSFIIHQGDRIGIIGVNGTGKTTLLDVLSGRIGFDGDVSPFRTKNAYKIAYLTQEPDFDESKTVLDTVLSSDLRETQLIREYELLLSHYDEASQARLEKVMAEMDSLNAWEIESQVKTVLSKLGITDLNKTVAELSGGLRRRVQLAQVLLGNADLLLLDEPTNDLDIATLTVLEHFLQGFTGPVITVSHDRYFLDKVANKILAFEDSGIETFFGNYTDYLDEKAFLASSSAISLEKPKEKTEKIKENKKRMSYFEKQEWATIEEDIAGLEERIAAIEAEMLTCGSDFTKLSDLQQELDEKNDLLLEKYERYEYLSELEG